MCFMSNIVALLTELLEMIISYPLLMEEFMLIGVSWTLKIGNLSEYSTCSTYLTEENTCIFFHAVMIPKANNGCIP